MRDVPMPSAAVPADPAEVRARLRRLHPALRRADPIRPLRVCGSRARGEQTPDGGRDLLVAFDGPIGLSGVAGLQQNPSDALGVNVDRVTAGALTGRISERFVDEAVPVRRNQLNLLLFVFSPMAPFLPDPYGHCQVPC